jgi:uncharacterized protein YecT (DUF1311 family)
MKLVIAGMIAVASIASAATGAQAQSFNCRKAYFPDEKLICTSPHLSMLDERLDWIFRQNMRLLAKPGRDALDREEERWVVARRRCGGDHRCVEGFYRSRIGELTERLGEARNDDRDEPSAMRQPWRDGPPSERFPPEAPRAEQPDRGERATAAPIAKRQSGRGEESRSSREEEAAVRRVPPPASESRQSAPVRAGAEAPQGSAAAATGPERSRRSAVPRAPDTTSPGPASGSTVPVPRIEFADPAPGTPASR